jgi:two-component system, NtrC family, response regulator
MSNPKILIVDDDKGIRTQLKWGLEGYDIITADSRPHALEQFNLHQPPLVTLDLGLPPDIEGTTEGFAILKAILKQAPETKVVIVSGSDALDSEKIAKNNGAFEFHSKPVSLDRLQQVIKDAYADYKTALSKH